ncbi:germin-like protein, putative [Medicago truncatula]|uniref:Germin-like protein, putative n=1 Tax=Medicago truncatula TaxID=3880 RepID=A0A072U879_MEDTR|nr:germin-like protein, putative [Medicago truncatula]
MVFVLRFGVRPISIKQPPLYMYMLNQTHSLLCQSSRAVNSCAGEAIAFATYSSSKPSFQFLDYLLFGNKLPTSIIAKTTLLDVSQIKKLKGTG